MKRTQKFIAIGLILMLQFCSRRNAESVGISGTEVSLSVEADVLKHAIDRRLSALESKPPVVKKNWRYIEPMSAIDPVHKKSSPPE